jgi:hypothetical protein
MSFNSATSTYEATVGVMPSWIMINTGDTLATVKGTGYLNGQTLNPFGVIGYSPAFTTGQMALVSTSDSGTVILMVQIDGSSNINLVTPSAA